MPRPKTSRKSLGFSRISVDGWEHFWSLERRTYPINGKYLFFSKERETLVAVVVEELESGYFHRAKLLEDGINPRGEDYVLCMFFADASRHAELRERYQGREGVRYHSWKTNEDTALGKYSAAFLGREAARDQFDLLKDSAPPAGDNA